MRPRRRGLTAILRAFAVVLGIAVVPHVINLVERWSWDAHPFARARARIRAYVRDSGVPSVTVAAARNGRIVWEESFGWADVERRVEATPETMYALASTSKTFTATGVMALVERGLLDLDRPVSDYLADVGLRAYEGDASDVTLRRIFTHTSGLPQFWRYYLEDELATRPDVRELVDRYGILVSPPGERFIYSNVGIGLAHLVIESVSGTDYEEFMRSEVLDPLRLTRTAILAGPYEDAGIAQKYMRGEKLPFGDMGFRAAGSFWASAHDLVRFGMFHLGDRLAGQRPRWAGIPGKLWQSWARLGRRVAEAAMGTRALTGAWVGEIRTAEARISMRLVVDERGGAELWIGDGSGVAGKGHVSADAVFATFPARILTAETARDEHHVILDLRLHGHRLAGPVYAESTRRPVFWLPFYAQLTRGE